MAGKEEVLKALGGCKDPELGKDIVSLGMVQNLEVSGGTVSFDYVLTTPSCPLKDKLEAEARAAVLEVPGVKKAEIRMKARVKPDLRPSQVELAGIKNILAVGSGKGGVGKSTVAANIAVSLALDGAKVGLLDADIYGPNVPQMMGIAKYAPKAGADDKLEPPVGFGVKVISMGFFVDTDSPVIWRGPMVHGAIVQLLKEISWGELDYLVVDLPPGTGDAQLSLC
ncbi:MAG: P-loop NTPase, partial [Elusimicrobia bacterium]|nr:P-loop NTPase [Elusimicrobiota bacterium]